LKKKNYDGIVAIGKKELPSDGTQACDKFCAFDLFDPIDD